MSSWAIERSPSSSPHSCLLTSYSYLSDTTTADAIMARGIVNNSIIINLAGDSWRGRKKSLLHRYGKCDEETWAFEDEGEYRIDEHGVGYSLDGHRLLFARMSFKGEENIVPDGVVTICSMAFATCRQFVTLIIPRSVRLIGDSIFGPGGGKILIK